jgi:protein-tyrosine phosphatase
MNIASFQLHSAPNFRDIGGVPGADGRLVRRGVIFRSEAVLAPDESDITLLDDIGIGLVCDLRGHHERDLAPNRWWMSAGAELLELDILADIRTAPAAWAALRADPSAEGGRAIMHSIYRALPGAAAPHLGRICLRIADGGLPLLIHCTAGKDRTGFLCAVLLKILGVSAKDIESDYLKSAGRASEAVTNATRALILHNAGEIVSEGAIEAIIGVDRSYLATSFREIDVQFGGFDAYLSNAVGLDQATIEQVRTRLIE